jgi:hypothetical protein
LNKQQVDNLITALINVPQETKAKVLLQGVTEAQAVLAALEGSLRTLAQPIIIPIVAQAGLTGVASPNYVPTLPQILTGQNAGFGGSGPGGIPGGTGHATGGIAQKGWSWIGERGPELVNFGSPSRVLTHHDSIAAMSGGGSGVTVNLTVQALDPKSVSPSMRQQWARETAIEIARAQKNGYKLN